MADYNQLTKRLLGLAGMYGTEGARPVFGGMGRQATPEAANVNVRMPPPPDALEMYTRDFLSQTSRRPPFSEIWSRIQDMRSRGVSDEQIKYQLQMGRQKGIF